MSRQNIQKQPMEWKTILFMVLLFIGFNILIAFPFVIILIVMGCFKYNISLNRILKTFWVTDYLKNNFWTNYEKIILEIKKSKKYQQRVKRNSVKKSNREELFTDSKWVQIDEWVEMKTEARFNQMQRELDTKRNKEKMFYQHNQKRLQEKLSNTTKKKNIINTASSPWKNPLSSTHNTKNNFFWNTKKSDSFGSGKSIWDNYESVTDKFSSNKK